VSWRIVLLPILVYAHLPEMPHPAHRVWNRLTTGDISCLLHLECLDISCSIVWKKNLRFYVHGIVVMILGGDINTRPSNIYSRHQRDSAPCTSTSDLLSSESSSPLIWCHHLALTTSTRHEFKPEHLSSLSLLITGQCVSLISSLLVFCLSYLEPRQGKLKSTDQCDTNNIHIHC